jgi:RNA polymerase primary sigma factor
MSLMKDRYIPEVEEETTMAELIALGRKKKFATLDDILHFFPNAEKDIDQLEEVFSALLTAGVAFVEDEGSGEPPDSELPTDGKEITSNPGVEEEDYLANIDVSDGIGLYIREVSRVPLLTAAEEIDLARRMERGREAREELALGKSKSRRRSELRKFIEDGWAAREHLIQANSRLVVSVAKKYMGRGVPFLDLIQEGNIGLIRSAKKFNYHRGYKFSTYATWWIRQAVTRAVADQGRTIRLPVHMSEQINRVFRTQHRLAQFLGRDPTVQEMAEELEMPPKKIERIFKVSRRPLSLEMPTGDEEDAMLGDFVEDNDAPQPDQVVTDTLLSESLYEVMNGLRPREVRILQLRYGLLDGQTYTLEEVGRKMGVTRERVRQIEAQAMSRLRHPAVRRKLHDYLEE